MDESGVSVIIYFQGKYEGMTSTTACLKSTLKEDKPSIDDHHESLGANYLNALRPMHKGTPDREEKTAISVLNLLNGCVKLVHGCRDAMGKPTQL